MANRTRAAWEAGTLLRREYHGVLSTLSVDVPGYPFGSIVPYALDREGRPIILISRIAQHTKNIEADPRVSLIVSRGGADDVQSAPRLTWLADAIRVPDGDEETPARYYRYFPDARGYHRVHDFDFYRLAPVRARYIGGFGEIHWIAAAPLLKPNPFTEDEELGMVRHMNEDHVEAMIRYCDAAHIPLAAGIVPAMAGVDADGFHLRLGARIVRFEFPAPVATPLEVRTALVAMARREAHTDRG
jgi:putative heme iron utilization protein